MRLISAIASALLASAAYGMTATLSNTQLPVDNRGLPLLTGEATVLADPSGNGTYWFYFNNWGGCAGIDCCTSGSCASCCFNPPTPTYNDTCVYTGNHSVVVYSTADFTTWMYQGEALPLAARLPGIEFRPQVVYNKLTKLFVMWYEDRWNGQDGYAVATSATAAGPFVTLNNSVKMSGPGRIGDYDVFVDADGSAYHVRTGVTIEALNAEYTAPTGVFYAWSEPSVEAPAMFRRDNTYYILLGAGCCACIGGSDIQVWTSTSPMGPFALQAEVGRNASNAPFPPSSPLNYVTHAQTTKVFTVGEQYVYMGNQWVTSTAPGRPRNNDLLYFDVLAFNGSGVVQQFVRKDNVTITVP